MKQLTINHDAGDTVFTMYKNAILETEVQHIRIDVSLQKNPIHSVMESKNTD